MIPFSDFSFFLVLLQFQSFVQFRGKLKMRTAEEILILKDNPKMWNIHSVLNVLYSLVAKSRINQQVSAPSLPPSLSLSLRLTVGFSATSWRRRTLG